MDVAVATAMAVVVVAVAGTAMAGWEATGCIKWWHVRRRTLDSHAQGRMYAAGYCALIPSHVQLKWAAGMPPAVLPAAFFMLA